MTGAVSNVDRDGASMLVVDGARLKVTDPSWNLVVAFEREILRRHRQLQLLLNGVTEKAEWMQVVEPSITLICSGSDHSIFMAGVDPGTGCVFEIH